MRKIFLIISLLLTACAPVVTQPIVATPTRLPGPTPTPEPAWSDLTPFRAAMRPEFAQDLDQFQEATRYKIDLSISPDLTSYHGQQQVHYINTETAPLPEVYFRLFPNTPSYGGDMTITSLQVNGQAAQSTMELSDSAMRIPMNPPLQPGAAVDFNLSYVTTVPTQSVSLGYDQFGYFRGVLALPNFFPIIPVYDAEGWNVELAPGIGDSTFTDSALYEVNLTAPADQVVATSGVCDHTSSGATGSWHCVSGPMRDFMIGLSADYQVASSEIDGIKVNSYFLPKDAQPGRNGLQFTLDALKSYEQRIGPYPFNELDLLETPTTAGGIEYPGLVVVAQDLYTDSPTFQEGATAHEVAHQWWYSLVGNDQLDDPWLDEAMAQFMTALYWRDTHGPQAMQSDVKQDLSGRYSRVKGTTDDKRADLPVASYTGLQYSSIVYGKAALFFNAVYDQLGDEKFNAWLHTYFEKYRYGIAYDDDLINAIETQLDKATTEELLKQWITTP
jgi:hypothetical protein